VRILAVDAERKTLSLTMEEPEEDFSGELQRLNADQRSESRRGGAMADLFDAALPRDQD
jgi:hypothetical protein